MSEVPHLICPLCGKDVSVRPKKSKSRPGWIFRCGNSGEDHQFYLYYHTGVKTEQLLDSNVPDTKVVSKVMSLLDRVARLGGKEKV